MTIDEAVCFQFSKNRKTVSDVISPASLKDLK